ncbi:MAG: transcriptional regulator NrdR [Chloroflexota bacterium]|nr:transcriptional regulator NrdR [Chloroflexota bacterium]MDE2930779.1 transcriptional regulator NrdR [Chloroflexota bacterium]
MLACPHCESIESRVASYQLLKAGSRRFRECLRCGREFTTTERVDPVPLTVVKRDGRREEFNRGKLRDKISTACWKRPVSSEQVGHIVDGIERDLLELGEPEVESTVIGDRVMQRLRVLDEVAYVRFASVYRRFEDIDSIAEEIAEYQQWKRSRAQPDQIALLPEPEETSIT